MTVAYVLGAGVDRALGLPLANALLGELATFESAEGKPISQALKAKLGGARRVRFNFEKYRANQGEGFAERVLSDGDTAAVLESALDKIKDGATGGAAAVKTLMSNLAQIRKANEFDEDTALAIAGLSGEGSSMADYSMLNWRGISLNPTPRNAMVRLFRDAQAAEGLSDDEKNALDNVVAAMTNFEELLSELFAGFYASNKIAIRNYLYVAWLLWVYIHWKTQAAKASITATPNFYKWMEGIPEGDGVITFNYTILGNLPAERIVRFHGDCHSYIRFDRGELLTDDESVTKAVDLDGLRSFIDKMDMDVDAGRILVPGIVPPSAMKPLINRAFIRRWMQAETLMTSAQTLIVAGYAFNRIDSHFNDLFRFAAPGKRIAVINPDLDGTLTSVCDLLGVNPTTLSTTVMEGTEVRRSANLLLVPAKAEDVTENLIKQIRAGW